MRFLSVFKHSPQRTSKGILAVGLFLCVFSAILVMLTPEPLQKLDRIAYDLMLHRLGEKPHNPNVLIVDVDEASLSRYGQWPWPRHLVARLLDTVRDGKPDSVGVDILFAEPDRSSMQFVNMDLKAYFDMELDISGLPPEVVDHDWALSRTLHRGTFYLGLMFRFGEGNTIQADVPDSRLAVTHVSRMGDGVQPFPVADGAVVAIPQLATAADGLGFVNAVPDSDGVLRRMPLFIRYGGNLYPSLALAAYMQSRQNETVVIASGPEGLVSIKAGKTLIPVDRQGFVALRFRGPSGTYPHISAADVLDGKISREVDLLVKSSPLHDVGKVGVRDSILLKPGPLTPSEVEEMKKHTVLGAETLARAESASSISDDTSFLKTAREIALTHHEKWDGTGYPYGLKGKNIPLSGRLMALADMYDALISERVYKKAMSHETAVAIIRNRCGTQFDPEIVKVFEALADEFLAINLEYADKKEV